MTTDTPTPVPAASERLRLLDGLQTAVMGLRCALAIFDGSNMIGPRINVVRTAFKVAAQVYDHEGTVAVPQPAASERMTAEQIIEGMTDCVGPEKWFNDCAELLNELEGRERDLLALVDKQAEELGELRLLKRMLGEPLGNLATLSARAEAAERELANLQQVMGGVLTRAALIARAEAAEARAETARDLALKACRKAMRDCFDEEFESLQEGLMTDADITDKEREAMRWQLNALDVWREDMPDRAELYAIAALTAPPPTAKDAET